MLNNILKISLLFIVITFTASFSANAAQSEAAEKEAGATVIEESVNKDAASETDDEREYIYDPTGKTDPFKSFITTQQEALDQESEKPKTYLETLELSQLSLTSVIVSDKGKWAMVTDSKKVGHVIKEGTPIGRNGGVVYKIKPGEVIIREEYRNFKGEKTFKDITKKPPPVR